MAQCAPSAERNKVPIADVLRNFKPFAGGASSSCLEIASGTGQHVAFFASTFPHVTFQPTEYSGGSSGPEAPAYGSLNPVFASILAHSDGLSNVLAPVELDASSSEWPSGPFDAVYACNVCHISPYSVTEGILRESAKVLKPNGGLFIYGPFMVDGEHTAESNLAFDQRLRAQNAEWGVRDSTAIAAAAASCGLQLVAREAMPANNFVLAFEKAGG